MIFIRSFFFQVFLIIFTFLIGLISFPFLLLNTKKHIIKIAYIWTIVIVYMQKILLGINYVIEGQEYCKYGGYIYAVKHQSAWETLIFHHLLSDPTFIIKKELLWIPIVGSFLKKTGQIAVNREGGKAALKKLVLEARKTLEENRPIVIFPEGHRQPPGTTGTYHRGILALYGDCHKTVIPVALNSGLFWGRNSFLKYPGTITLKFLPEIAPGLSQKNFMTLLENVIETATRELEARVINIKQ